MHKGLKLTTETRVAGKKARLRTATVFIAVLSL